MNEPPVKIDGIKCIKCGNDEFIKVGIQRDETYECTQCKYICLRSLLGKKNEVKITDQMIADFWADMETDNERERGFPTPFTRMIQEYFDNKERELICKPNLDMDLEKRK